MKLRFFSAILTALSLIIVLSACKSTDYYRDRAVQRARKFLLEEDRTLNLEQREYVKFNKPVIMAASIFDKIGTDSATSGALSHICVAWIIEGKKDAYVVFGVSDNRLRDWTPNRVITKRYDIPIYNYNKANRAAMLYAVNNFLYMSNQQLNKIRFEVPETIITDYEFGKKTLKANNISRGTLKSREQITFVWSSTKPGYKVFVCGIGAKDLAGWRAIFGGETPADKLRSHFLKTVFFGQFGGKMRGIEEKKKAKKVEKVKK